MEGFGKLFFGIEFTFTYSHYPVVTLRLKDMFALGRHSRCASRLKDCK